VDVYKALFVALLLIGSMVMLSSYIMQPMRLFDTFLRLGPVARVPMSGVMSPRGSWIGNLNTFAFSFGNVRDVSVRDLPDMLALSKLQVQ
jgi:hypothetical protein